MNAFGPHTRSQLGKHTDSVLQSTNSFHNAEDRVGANSGGENFKFRAWRRRRAFGSAAHGKHQVQERKSGEKAN